MSRDEPYTIVLAGSGAEVEPAHGSSRAPNAIHTTRFTPITWLPKSLYFQFHRVANIYFVMIAILACTPLWGGKWQPKVFMVVSILVVQALKDGYEDVKRNLDDRDVNSRVVRRYNLEEDDFDDVMWQDCSEGDVLMIEKGESVPVDLLVLSSEDSSGVFYMSTKSLDGETNLKEGRIPPLMAEEVPEVMGNLSKKNGDLTDVASILFQIGLEASLEAPHASLSDIKCSLTINGKAGGAGVSNFAMRGCELQNTSRILGVACYVGDNTKVRLNSSEPPSKTSELENVLNRCVMCILCFIVSIAVVFAILSLFVDGGAGDVPFYEVFVKYLVILYAVLPMTLYVAFEILHLIAGFQIEHDVNMYDEDTVAYAKARNTSIVEELGQVDFVFSDKTGTLTANEMRFAYCCIDSEVIGSFLPSSGSREESPGVIRAKRMLQGGGTGSREHQEKAGDFFEALAVCHTLKVDDDGTYQGESPDEVALVEAAGSVGYTLVERYTSAGGVVHKVDALGGVKDYLMAEVLNFTSDRKRMSVICPSDGGGAIVLTKGADTVMERLLDGPLPAKALNALQDFSRQGLRTLVVARRKLDATTYSAWKLKWDQANAAMENRSERIASIAAEVETNMTYVGITALEDRLQDGVPGTIASLREAGIRVWVLTGDKVETAVEIAKSCKLFEDGMHILSAAGASSADEAIESLTGETEYLQSQRGMVLDGKSVTYILEDESARASLYELAENSSSCVCCRLSPMQKRELVELVREQNERAITLSIGDGANDVPMIQGAHIGVGIRGKEGSASVQASDVAISQFRFLRNLVFCHGRKAYRRIATFLCFFIYKSVVLGWSYIIFAHDMLFSGDLAYPEWLDSIYNPMTSCAAVIMLAFDFDYSDKMALHMPDLYRPGHERAYLNPRVFAQWMLFASIHGILAWSVPVYTSTTRAERLQQSETFWEASFTAFTIILITVHLKLVIIAVKPMNFIGISAVVIELLLYIPAAIFLSLPVADKMCPEMQGVPVEVITSGSRWLQLLITPCIALFPDLMKSCVDRRRYSRGDFTEEELTEDSAESDKV